MAYKKYIKRDGKLYGPYIYQSKRVDGKVVSEYCGPGKKDYKKFVLPILGLFIFVALIILFFNFKGNFTGNVIVNDVNKNAEKVSEKALEPITLNLKQGEFIPASSLVIFETPINNYEYILSELVSEKPISGEYYIEGESLSGEGEGYGLAGENKNAQKVYFTLVSRKQNSAIEGTEQTSAEVVQENELTSETTENRNSTIEITTEQTVENPTESIPETADTISETITEQTTDVTENTQPSEEPTQTDEGIVSQVLEVVGNFFLGLGLTGNTINSNTNSIQETEISGEASLNNPFSYNLEEGENVELLSGSVKTDSNKLPDKTIILKFEEGKVVVEVEYVKVSEGFGENYLGDKEKVLSLAIPSEINLSQGYNVKLVYSAEQNLEIQTQENNEIIISNQESLNESFEEQNTSNLTLEIDLVNTEALTPQEKEFLKTTLGDIAIQTTKSELSNGRYVIGYVFGDYTIEYSYDASLDENLLDSQIEKDRVKWLKDIYNSLIEEEQASKEVTFNSSFLI